MPRSHARLGTSIWTDSDFLARSALAQRLYMVLISQPNLGHAGILTIACRRWARLAPDTTEDDIRAGLAELDAADFLVVDEDTDEVLIRSFIRNDHVWKQPKVLAVAITEAAGMTSPRLRDRVARELRRIDPSELPSKTRDIVEKQLADMPDRLAEAHRELPPDPPRKGGGDPPPDPPREDPAEDHREVPEDPHAEARAEGPWGRGSSNGEEVSESPVPVDPADPLPADPADQDPEPPPADADAEVLQLAASGQPSPRKPRRKKSDTTDLNAGNVVAAWVDAVERAQGERPAQRLVAQVGRQARELIEEGKDPARLVSAATAAGTKGFADLGRELLRMNGQQASATGTDGIAGYGPRAQVNNITDREIRL